MSVNEKQRRDASATVASKTAKQTLAKASIRMRYIKAVLAMEEARMPLPAFNQVARESYLLGLSRLEKATQPSENL